MLSTARNQYLLKRIEKTLERVCATQKAVLARGSFRPAFAELQFGMDDANSLPPLQIRTPGGRDVLLRGKIDRVDLLPAGQHAAVFDYRLGSRTLSLGEAFHGLSLQLLAHLLVLQANGQELAGKPLTPAAAFYLQVSRRLGDVDHPAEALDPANPRFHLRVKPRGVFDATFLPAFDGALGEDGRSDVVHARVKKDGTFGYRNASDVADANEFAGLLAFVRRRLGELADGILAGVVEVRPYRINRDTPCPRCEYRSVCRFDPSINTYRHLPPMRREDVLKAVTEGGPGDGA
jgi:ATP-dependent helicase/nuclease subunit B